MLKLGINGLGRIGKAVLRAYAENPKYHEQMEIRLLNTRSGTAQNHAHLIKYDSMHGIFDGIKGVKDDAIDVGFGYIPISFQSQDIDFTGIDVILECTGAYKDRSKAAKHLISGAKKVIVSAPCKDADNTIVFGCNENTFDASKHDIISIGSCTTNCLAPIAKLLNNNFGIEKGFMTTIHSYTSDQQILDKSHNDLQRARAAAVSMIPTSTGAAQSIGIVMPELKGKLAGKAIRVPTPNVSFLDFAFTTAKETSTEEINTLFSNSCNEFIGYAEEKLVSVDFNGNTQSAVLDANETSVIDKTFCRIGAWYDNEIGFSHRMLDAALLYRNIS